MNDDLRITQLLCSRLCHDLVGPVGAINNGIELIEDAPDMLEDSLALLSDSARAAARRLAFYRVAFGFGGGDGASALNDVRRLSADFLSEGNVALDWPADAGDGQTIVKDAAKLLMNMVLLGAGALPRGGDLRVRLNGQESGLGVSVVARGQNAGLKDEIRAALADDFPVAELTAHTVQGRFTARLAQSLGTEMTVTDNGGDEIELAAVVHG